MTGQPSAPAWDDVPAGLAVLRLDGTVLRANRTLLAWLGRTAEQVEGQVRLSELLSVGGRIYWETHLSPLLHVEGRADEVALELRTPGGRLPVLLSAVVSSDRAQVQVLLAGAGERTRYERELLAARQEAERSGGRLHALQATTSALSRAVGVDAVAGGLLLSAVGPIGAAAATVWLTDADTGLAPRGSEGEPPGSVQLPAAGVVLQERRAVRHGGRVVVPLHGHSVLQGVLSLAEDDAPGSDPLDLELLTAVGQQAGLALDRAQLYEQSADVAHELQQSLLAVEPPDDPRFVVATVYRPGVEALAVGGDWYDVFLAEAGVLSVVVGDVVGRGLGAASAMGQLRSAVRAVAGPDVGPARLLSRLDRFVDQVEAAGMATVAYAELDLHRGLLRYACAGHPPPVLLPADGPPRLLWEGRSTPLGAFVTPQVREESTVELVPGDRLLLYTDGLVERRDRSLDDGLAALLTAAGSLAELPLPQAVRSLTTDLLQDEQGRDDVCVLLLRWSGGHFERHLSADLAELSLVRHELAGWLAGQGVDEAVAHDLVLATSEATANAAEHGSGRRDTELVTVRARIDSRPDLADEVVVSVRDAGRWRTPQASDERGRGLYIIGQLVDDVLVESGDGTTVVMRRGLGQVAS